MCTTTPSLFIVRLSPSGSWCHLSREYQESGRSEEYVASGKTEKSYIITGNLTVKMIERVIVIVIVLQ